MSPSTTVIKKVSACPDASCSVIVYWFGLSVAWMAVTSDTVENKGGLRVHDSG
jgi:hypothetical protein